MFTAASKLTTFALMSIFMSSPCNAYMKVMPKTSFKYLGSTKPLENFDPLNILKDKSDNRIKFTREAELQHGRLAMMACVAIPVLEMMNDDPEFLGVKYLSELDFVEQLPCWLTVALYETARMKCGWTNPFTPSGKTFTLKEEYQPGNVLNFDASKINDSKYDKELNNGRLAMIGFMGLLGQELIASVPIF